jgi:hypothetical protein
LQFDATIYLVLGDEVMHTEPFKGTRAEARAAAKARLQASGADRAEIWSGPVRVAEVSALKAEA